MPAILTFALCLLHLAPSAPDSRGPGSGQTGPAGSWHAYETAQRGHAADLGLSKNDDGRWVGTWADGYALGGAFGHLIGTEDGPRIYLRFCSIDRPDQESCDDFGPVDGYVERHGDTLRWYRSYGDGVFRLYLDLVREPDPAAPEAASGRDDRLRQTDAADDLQASFRK